MDAGTIALVVCAVYLAATLVAGVAPGIKAAKSVEGFVAASRSMGPVLLYFVLGASIFSAFAFLGGPGWAYSRGAAALYILAYGALGMVPLYFFGPRARRLGERFGFVTQAELLAHRFESRALSVLLAVLSVAVFIPYLTLQMKGAGYILETLSGGRIGMAAGAGISYAVVLVYVLTAASFNSSCRFSLAPGSGAMSIRQPGFPGGAPDTAMSPLAATRALVIPCFARTLSPSSAA